MKKTFQRRLTLAMGLLVSGTVFVMTAVVEWSAVTNILSHYETTAVAASNLATRYVRDRATFYEEEHRRAKQNLARSKVNLEEALQTSGTIPPGQSWEAFSDLLDRSLNELQDTLLPPFSLQATLDDLYARLDLSEAFALDESGRVVAHVGPLKKPEPEVLVMLRDLLEDSEARPVTRKVGPEVGVATLLQLPGQDRLVLYLQHRLTHGQELIKNTITYVSFFAAVLVVGSLALAVWVSRSLSRPIDQLARGMRELGEGNLDFQLELETRDEIQEVAQAVGNVVGSLRTAYDELEQETSRRERLEHELHIASELQLALLPEAPPHIEGIDLLGWSRPAKEVGGDFYDFIEFGPKRLGVAIGDASGKGLPAALLVTESWSVLRTLAEDLPAPGELLYRTNNALTRRVRATGRFVTLFFMVIDLEQRLIRYASAGHNPPVLIGVREGRRIRLSVDDGFPLGIVAGARFSEHEVALEPGDTLLLYSDGLTEAQSPSGKLYGEKRLAKRMDELGQRPLLEILAGLKQDMDDHIQGAEVYDDVTLVGVRYQPPVGNK